MMKMKLQSKSETSKTLFGLLLIGVILFLFIFSENGEFKNPFSREAIVSDMNKRESLSNNLLTLRINIKNTGNIELTNIRVVETTPPELLDSFTSQIDSLQPGESEVLSGIFNLTPYLFQNNITFQVKVRADSTKGIIEGYSTPLILRIASDGSPCDDGNPCTINDVWVGTNCVGEPMDCDDDNPCTQDYCVNGECVNEPIVGLPCGQVWKYFNNYQDCWKYCRINWYSCNCYVQGYCNEEGKCEVV